MRETIWARDEFKPLAPAWHARQHEFARRESYYDGSVYEANLRGLSWLHPRAAQAIRPLYLPLSRAVNVDAGLIPGGWALAPDLPDRERIASAVQQILRASGWDEDGVLYCHYGSLYGNAGLRVADLRAEGRIVLSPVNPRAFMLAGAGLYDSTPRAAIVVQEREGGESGQGYEYAEVITADSVRTFANGEPQGFDGRPAEYPNLLGFIPFVEVRHIHNGGPIGDCAFEKVLPLLDQVNRLASELADVIHRYKEPQYVISGAEASELVRGGDHAWFMPQGARVEILIPELDIPGILEFIRESRSQVERGLVQLGFDQVTSRSTAIAAETVKLQLLELVIYIQRTRPNYDRGLVEALRMIGRAAKGDWGASGRDLAPLAVLDSGALAFDSARPVLPNAVLGVTSN